MGWCSMHCTWSDDTLHGTPCKDCRWTCNRMGSMDNLEVRIMNIVETHFGTKIDPNRIALGSASPITRNGAFFIFSVRVDTDDIREYSFTNRNRAVAMREVLISHLENKIKEKMRRRA